MQIHPPPGAVQGEAATIGIGGFSPGPLRCRVRHHDGGETEELNVQHTRGGAQAQFTPDRPGRWWIGVRSSDDFKEIPFWVQSRRV